MVGLETDGGDDHNHKYVINQLALFGFFLLGNTDKINTTRGCPGLYFLNTANRAMAFLNTGFSGVALKSNVQVGDELLMDEIIGNASLMKPVREAVQEYDTELPLDILVLEHRLGCNIYVASSTIIDEPTVITEDGNNEEEIQESINSVEIQEVVEVGHHTDSSRSTSSTTSERVRKFFLGMG